MNSRVVAARAMTTNPIIKLAEAASGVSRVLLRASAYAKTPRRDWWLLDVMSDSDITRWASQSRKQRAYSLSRRRHAHETGRAILTEPRSSGRSK